MKIQEIEYKTISQYWKKKLINSFILLEYKKNRSTSAFLKTFSHFANLC